MTLKLGIRNGKPAWVSDAFPGDPRPTPTDLIAIRDASKLRNQGAIVFAKIGDFYETFDDDAVTLCAVVGLVCQSYKGRPHAGIPYHMLNTSTAALLAAGHRVIIT